MNEPMIAGIFLGVMGCFSIAGAVFNWNWFMNSRRAAFLVKIMGRNGARVFYILLGTAILGFAIYGQFHPEIMHHRRGL